MGAKAQIPRHCHVTCVIPGLVWPAPLGAALEAIALPGLAAWLGRAQIARSTAQPYASWLARQFGLTQPAWAALRWAGEVEQATHPAHTLCADPVSLHFMRDAIVLRGPADLAITPAEATGLLATLNSEFADLGSFHAPQPERWYLHAKAATQTHFLPLADVLGRPVALFQPEGPDAAIWARTANELQIVLHNHPVNRQREERGQPLINALWFWGEAPAQAETLTAPAQTLIGDDPILRGLAQHAGANWQSTAQAGPAGHGPSGHSWRLDTRLQEAALTGDFMGWLRGLEQLERELFAPLWQTWQQGSLKTLRLVAPSDKALLEAVLSPAQKLRFWRRSATGAQLRAILETPAQPDPT